MVLKSKDLVHLKDVIDIGSIIIGLYIKPKATSKGSVKHRHFCIFGNTSTFADFIIN